MTDDQISLSTIREIAKKLNDALKVSVLESVLHSLPVGTKAMSIGGGHWFRTEQGWKWNGPEGNGGTFPRPGGDWSGDVVLPPKVLIDAGIQIETCDKCGKQDFYGPGGGSFWGPWFYCAEHDAELNASYEEYCAKRALLDKQ